MRPHICWFAEVPFEMDAIEQALRACTILVTLGSSGNVYPAAGFVTVARQQGTRTVYLGPEAPETYTRSTSAVWAPRRKSCRRCSSLEKRDVRL